MKTFLRITRFPYEEPYHLQLLFTAANGRQQGELEIYCNAKDLAAFARSLQGFPKPKESQAIWELGSENPNDRFAFYFRIRALQLSPSGRCALELRFCNNFDPPIRSITEFSIEALPADFDRLAQLLEQFSKLEQTQLEWIVNNGALR
jgi:hypothetical protein